MTVAYLLQIHPSDLTKTCCAWKWHHRDLLEATAVGQHCPSSALLLTFNCIGVKSRVRLIKAVAPIHGTEAFRMFSSCCLDHSTVAIYFSGFGYQQDRPNTKALVLGAAIFPKMLNHDETQ